MEGGPPCFPQTHRGSWYSGSQHKASPVPYGTLTPSGAPFQELRVRSRLASVGPTTPPDPQTRWFGLLPFRSPLLWESRLISSRAATEMFQFTACPSPAYACSMRCLVITPGGLPHSDAQGSSLVCSSPCTFRRSPRPSSAFSAWASPSYSLSLVCYYLLVLTSSVMRPMVDLTRIHAHKLPLFSLLV